MVNLRRTGFRGFRIPWFIFVMSVLGVSVLSMQLLFMNRGLEKNLGHIGMVVSQLEENQETARLLTKDLDRALRLQERQRQRGDRLRKQLSRQNRRIRRLVNIIRREGITVPARGSARKVVFVPVYENGWHPAEPEPEPEPTPDPTPTPSPSPPPEPTPSPEPMLCVVVGGIGLCL